MPKPVLGLVVSPKGISTGCATAVLQRSRDRAMVFRSSNPMGVTYSPEAVFNQPPPLEELQSFRQRLRAKRSRSPGGRRLD